MICSRRLLIENVKNGLDRTQNDVQRNAPILPSLDERPIERAQEKVLIPASDKGVRDLCEVIEVIQASLKA